MLKISNVNCKKEKDNNLHDLIPELPSGPLDEYRRKASFDWRQMKLFLDSQKNINFKNKIYEFMKNEPLFERSNHTQTVNELQHLTTKRMYAFKNQKFLNEISKDPSLDASETEAIVMYDSSLFIKYGLMYRAFDAVLRTMGKPYHHQFIEKAERGEIGGCFALTEVAHGSNVKGMRMTATYDISKKCFILNSPDFRAAKCLVGGLGYSATHAIVMAILISKGKQYGLQSFLVPIRDPVTLLPYSGVIVGDVGEKVGLNGIDNGFLMFNNYTIPFESQLDRAGGVNIGGDYETPFKHPSQRFGVTLSILSTSRIRITSISCSLMQKAVVIAARYSAVRKQFAPNDSDEELSVISYQQQQIRVLPYLAATYGSRCFTNWFVCEDAKYLLKNFEEGSDKNASIRGIEFHAITCALKPVLGWLAQEALQKCREACGGWGYLTASRIGSLRNDNDANITYEGENSVLIQQSSNWLLSLWLKRHEKDVSKTVFGTVEFLEDADNLLNTKMGTKTIDSIAEPSNLLNAHRWVLAFLLRKTFNKMKDLLSKGMSNFDIRNNSQTYNASSLGHAYGENIILQHFYKSIEKTDNPKVKQVLLKLVSLYGGWTLEKHLSSLYMGGYFSGDDGILLQEAILKLCAELAPESVALADALAPPDFILDSALGNADGEIYKSLQQAIMTYPGSLTRPNWWKDVVHWKTYVKEKI